MLGLGLGGVLGVRACVCVCVCTETVHKSLDASCAGVRVPNSVCICLLYACVFH